MTKILESKLYDCNDAYILVNGEIIIIGHNVTQVAFKNCILFIKCINRHRQPSFHIFCISN